MYGYIYPIHLTSIAVAIGGITHGSVYISMHARRSNYKHATNETNHWKIWHFFVQEFGTIHTRLLKHPLNLLYERSLNYSSYYRIGHNFSDSFLDISSAVFITCCVHKTFKQNLIM